MEAKLHRFFTPMECIRLSRKFTVDETDRLSDTVCAIKMHGKLAWYIGYVPALYSILYEYPAFRASDIINKMCSVGDFSFSKDDQGYTVVFKQRTFSGYKLHDVLYRAAILSFEDVNEVDLTR